MVSMDDVAVKARVSKATVSRVLNGKKVVSPGAREKVLASCRELGYKLNHNIQDLILKSRNGFTRNIAFVIVGKFFADPAYAHYIDGIARAVNEAHYHLLLVKLRGDERNIYDLPPILRDERVDGIIITGNLQKPIIEVIKSLDSKCVVLGNYSERVLDGVASVRCKSGNRIAGMMEQLVRAGKRRIGFVEENPENYESLSLFAAYKELLAEYDLPFDPEICYFGKGSFSGVSDVLLPVMKREKLPFDSLICCDIRIAREVSYLLFGRFGLERPIEVTLATIRLFEYYTLPVPAVYFDTNVNEYMDAALRHLIDQIERNEKPKTILTDG
jgi:DNA-binding LacI/PurR family transcriptional regulator